jgi:hypothetical protein
MRLSCFPPVSSLPEQGGRMRGNHRGRQNEEKRRAKAGDGRQTAEGRAPRAEGGTQKWEGRSPKSNVQRLAAEVRGRQRCFGHLRPLSRCPLPIGASEAGTLADSPGKPLASTLAIFWLGSGRRGSFEQRSKSCLLEMFVASERVRHLPLAHDDKGDAIGQRPLFIRVLMI